MASIDFGRLSRLDALTLNPALDPAALTADFGRTGRLHIPEFLAPSSAQTLYQTLAGDSRWARVVMGGGTFIETPVSQLAAMSPEERANYVPSSDTIELEGLFDTLRILSPEDMTTAIETDYEPVADFLKGAAFLQAVRTITGDDRPARVDAQATRYGPGHYLTQHDDSSHRYRRLYAYVLNLTPVWRSDWGGLLNFIDASGHVAEAYTPGFNALNIFTVPQQHSVGIVAPFAQGARYSITGWIHESR